MTLILSLIVVGLVLLNTLIMASGSLNLSTSTTYSLQSSQALQLAEAGIDKAIASLNSTAGSYTGEDDVKLGSGSYTVTVTTQGNNKLITSTGYIPSKTNPRARREVQITLAQGDGFAFNYGVQVGNGGLSLNNNNTINGSVYANGNVTLDNGSRINGDIVVAGGSPPTSITGGNSSVVVGDVRANTIRNLTINGAAYYQTIQNSTASSYHPNSPDQPTAPLPIPDQQIEQWKNQAQTAGVYSGNISNCQPLTSQKYLGDVHFNNNCTVNVRSPIWITGDLTLDNNITLNLDPSFGTGSGVIIVDGQINLNNNNKVLGTGQGNSEIVLISTHNSQTLGGNAIELNNSGNSALLYAGQGNIYIGNNNHLQQVTGWRIIMNNNAVLNYDSGFASMFFNSGPTGSYSPVQGSYKLK